MVKSGEDALKWLGRDLPDAILKFIGQAKKGDTLLGCFYEFDYLPVLKAFKAAIDAQVDVTLIVDAKNNHHLVKGKEVPSSPRQDTIKALAEAGIPKDNVIYREANKNAIQHNKFIVFKPKEGKEELWTGSVNITESGIYGQTNVGHWLKDPAAAKQYESYWNLLQGDPGAKDNGTEDDKKKTNQQYIDAVMKISQDASQIQTGVTPVFSPRKNTNMLTKYFALVDKAKTEALITLAFGINAGLKKLLKKHTNASPTTFMMLEKKTKRQRKMPKHFTVLTLLTMFMNLMAHLFLIAFTGGSGRLMRKNGT